MKVIRGIMCFEMSTLKFYKDILRPTDLSLGHRLFVSGHPTKSQKRSWFLHFYAPAETRVLTRSQIRDLERSV